MQPILEVAVIKIEHHVDASCALPKSVEFGHVSLLDGITFSDWGQISWNHAMFPTLICFKDPLKIHYCVWKNWMTNKVLHFCRWMWPFNKAMPSQKSHYLGMEILKAWALDNLKGFHIVNQVFFPLGCPKWPPCTLSIIHPNCWYMYGDFYSLTHTQL